MNKMKKGFTVVELVVVIAVLAILVAVLIPTFSTLINKANLSKDTQLCRILNEDIAMGVDNQQLQEHATYYDVVEYLSPRYGIQNLTPTSTGDIVWDMNTNTFSLIDGGKFIYAGSTKTEANFKKNGVNLNLWKVVNSIPSVNDQKFSLYLNDSANVQTANIVVGFDAGNNTGVQNVNYDRSSVQNATAQTVVIRTNGGNLTINAELDTVKHYGTANIVNVQSVASNSYHENATSTFVKIAKGRIVVEEKAQVGNIYIPETTNTVIVATRNNVELPAIATAEANKTVTIQNLSGTSNTPVTTTTSEVLEQKTETAAQNDAASIIPPTFEDKYVACIGWNAYETLQAAFNAAKETRDGSLVSIRVLKDSSGNALEIKTIENCNILIDFNNHSYNVDANAAGSTGTVSQAFHFEKNNAVTMKNGTLTATSRNVKMLLQNYCNLTLDNMVLDGRDVFGTYVSSNNFGNVVIKDTTILTKTNQVAFDVWYGMSSVYDNGVTVTVTGNSVINGKVEYGAADRITGNAWVNTKAVLTIENTVDISNATFVNSSNHAFSIDASTGIVTVNE